MTYATTEATDDERSTDLETTLLATGRQVNVRNTQSGSGEVHTVHLTETGTVERCTCKGWKYHQTCYHADSVRSSPLLLSSAKAQVAGTRQVATDGGHVETETDDEHEDRFRLPEDPLHEDEPGTVELSPCPGCSRLTSDSTCGRARCEGTDEIDETPL